jgi:hypothetical protein
MFISRTSRGSAPGIRFLAFGLLAIFSTALPVAAEVIYTTGLGTGDNPAFDASGVNHDVAMQENSLGVFTIIADPFSLVADSTATDLLVPLSLLSTTSPFNNGAEVDLFIVPSNPSNLSTPDSDAGGNPLGALYHGSAAAITLTTGSIFDVSLTGSATLTAGVTYWLLGKTPGTSPGPGCSASTPCARSDDEWYNNNSSPQNGELADRGNGWGPAGRPAVAFTLEGSTTASPSDAPEPASFLLLSTGLLSALLIAAVRGTCSAT